MSGGVMSLGRMRCLGLLALAALLLGLGHRAARVPSTGIPATHWRHLLVVVLGAGFCGSFGETMRQLALVARTTKPQDSPPLR